jgi:diguanylate cyclase (GGDEF)-like protein/PAS domain S-box-containing protein
MPRILTHYQRKRFTAGVRPITTGTLRAGYALEVYLMPRAWRWLAACTAIATAIAVVDLTLSGVVLIAVVVVAGLSPAIALLRDRAERNAKAAAQGASTAAMMQASLDAMITMDESGRVLEWNPAAERIFGYSREEAVGGELAELIMPPSLRPQHRAGLARYLATGESTLLGCRIEVTAMRADRTEFPAELTVTRIDTDGPVVFAGALRDITARLRMEERLEHQALHDPLTDLPNRQLFLDRLERALSRARRSGERTALFFLDLDGFKAVNDGFGHYAGDRVLEAAATRLSESLRPSDTVARFGGDEFAIVCEGVDVAQTLAIGKRLRKALEVPLNIEGRPVSVTASTGVTFSEGGHGSPESLLSEADAAMYRAKERGWGRLELFDEAMRPDAAADRVLVAELRQALDRDELVVLYQPVVDVTAGTVVGAEALVRWDHPRLGRLRPQWFIPLAEETGLVEQIGELVLRQACGRAKGWARKSRDQGFAVAVNYSPIQLARPELATLVERTLEECGADPDALCIEVTERALAHRVDSSHGALESLSRLGVQIAIDDFGTGYSSLAQLRRLPVDTVKVDKAFVDGVDTRRDDSAIVRAVTEMAHALELGVVAEGVERAEQMSALRACGCDRAQGYLFGRPGVPERVDDLLAAAA